MSNRRPVTYVEYLGSQVEGGSRNRDLFDLMHQKEFVWVVPNDDNRIADGLEVRDEWNRSGRNMPEEGPCSFLEVLIALSRRLEHVTGEYSGGWARQLLVNLNIGKYDDPLSRYKVDRLDDVMEAVIWRTYSPDGEGGFFPLKDPRDDQRKIEIWYQMSAYIEEIYPD